jgi:hypothetical protein
VQKSTSCSTLPPRRGMTKRLASPTGAVVQIERRESRPEFLME